MRSLAIGAVIGTALIVLATFLTGRINAADDTDQQTFTPVVVTTKPSPEPDDPETDDPDDGSESGDDTTDAGAASNGSTPTAQQPERVQPRPRVAAPDNDSRPSPPSADSGDSGDSPPSFDT